MKIDLKTVVVGVSFVVFLGFVVFVRAQVVEDGAVSGGSPVFTPSSTEQMYVLGSLDTEKLDFLVKRLSAYEDGKNEIMDEITKLTIQVKRLSEQCAR